MLVHQLECIISIGSEEEKMTKRIVFIVERLSTGGAERVVATLANEICKLDTYEAYIITYHPKENDEYYISPMVRRIALKKSNYGRWRAIYQRYQQLKKIIYDIDPYCVFSLAIPKTDTVLMLALKDRRFPLIISERNDPARFPAEESMRQLRNFVYKRCEGLVYQTVGAKDYFDNIVTCKTTIICNPITSSLPGRYQGKREHRIVNFCRIEPQKNLKLAIDAFNLIRDEFEDYTLEFYGDGSQKQELEKYADSLHIGKNVIFHGYSSNIHEKIIKASLFISTSDYEGISNSMLEAMAIGLPTICTDCPPGGAKSVISDGENGVLVPVGDVEKLAEAMRTVLENEFIQNELSAKASLLAESLKPCIIAKKWLAFADEVRK